MKKGVKLIAEPLVRGLSPTPLLSAAQCCLTSQSGQDEVWPAWYERDRWMVAGRALMNCWCGLFSSLWFLK